MKKSAMLFVVLATMFVANSYGFQVLNSALDGRTRVRIEMNDEVKPLMELLGCSWAEFIVDNPRYRVWNKTEKGTRFLWKDAIAVEPSVSKLRRNFDLIKTELGRIKESVDSLSQILQQKPDRKNNFRLMDNKGELSFSFIDGFDLQYNFRNVNTRRDTNSCGGYDVELDLTTPIPSVDKDTTQLQQKIEKVGVAVIETTSGNGITNGNGNAVKKEKFLSLSGLTFWSNSKSEGSQRYPANLGGVLSGRIGMVNFDLSTASGFRDIYSASFYTPEAKLDLGSYGTFFPEAEISFHCRSNADPVVEGAVDYKYKTSKKPFEDVKKFVSPYINYSCDDSNGIYLQFRSRIYNSEWNVSGSRSENRIDYFDQLETIIGADIWEGIGLMGYAKCSGSKPEMFGEVYYQSNKFRVGIGYGIDSFAHDNPMILNLAGRDRIFRLDFTIGKDYNRIRREM